MKNKIGPYTDKEFQEMKECYMTETVELTARRYNISCHILVKIFGIKHNLIKGVVNKWKPVIPTEEMENDWKTNTQSFFKEKYGLNRQKGIELFGPAEKRTKEQSLAYARNTYSKKGKYKNQEEYHKENKDQFTLVVEKQIEDIMNRLKISYKKAKDLMSQIGYKSAMTARIEGGKIKYYAN